MEKIFNDTVHGLIEIPEICVKIIDTSYFQRLRNLKQLGLCYYVFPGATHNRFSHSIGVCWLTGFWLRHLQNKQPELKISDEEIEIVQLAALVHDIGHGPYSHTFEQFIKLTRPELEYSHEKQSMRIVHVFGPHGLKILNGVQVDNIVSILRGSIINRRFLAHVVYNPVNGLDADKLDYFLRDSYCTSFKIGCDIKRIIYESSVVGNDIVFSRKVMGDIWTIYETRFRLYRDLYYHKTVSKIEDMFLECLILADKYGIFNFNGTSLSKSIDDIDSFVKTNDDIIGQMERCTSPDIQQIINQINTRKFINTPKYTIKRIAHYGMKADNPLFYVKFLDKYSESPYNLSDEILNTFCPQQFEVEAEIYN